MRAEFDIAASTYDSDFTNSAIGQLQRNLVWKYLDECLVENKNLKILELNCGTGEDAKKFAEKGNLVMATDISEQMLKVAKSKANNCKISFQKLDLNKIHEYAFDADFDIVFSNFGGLNCIDADAISGLSKTVLKILQPNGKFIAVLMPKLCLWESFYFTIKGSLNEIFRRNKEFAMANVSGELVKTFYYSPAGFSKLLGDSFYRETLKPIGFFIPPSYLENYFRKRIGLLNILNKLDKWIAVFSWQASCSDHFYIQYTKR